MVDPNMTSLDSECTKLSVGLRREALSHSGAEWRREMQNPAKEMHHKIYPKS